MGAEEKEDLEEMECCLEGSVWDAAILLFLDFKTPEGPLHSRDTCVDSSVHLRLFCPGIVFSRASTRQVAGLCRRART